MRDNIGSIIDNGTSILASSLFQFPFLPLSWLWFWQGFLPEYSDIRAYYCNLEFSRLLDDLLHLKWSCRREIQHYPTATTFQSDWRYWEIITNILTKSLILMYPPPPPIVRKNFKFSSEQVSYNQLHTRACCVCKENIFRNLPTLKDIKMFGITFYLPCD